MNKYLTLRFIALALTINLESNAQIADSISCVNTAWEEYNLKGQVKEITVRFERFYSFDIPREKRSEYEMKNFWGMREFPMGKWHFDKNGLLRVEHLRYQDTAAYYYVIDRRNTEVFVFNYDTTDVALKRSLPHNFCYKFPIFDPNKIQVNYRQFKLDRPVESETGFKFEYNIENSKIIDEAKIDAVGVVVRKIYCYDYKDRIIRQDLVFWETFPPDMGGRAVMDEGLFVLPNLDLRVSINAVAYYTFAYDDFDRMVEAKLIKDDRLMWREEYFYEGENSWPSKLKRFIVSALTFEWVYSDDAIEWYNEYGDPLKSEYFDRDGNLIRTRYYDYVYDDQNNWIVCDMYLEGQPEKTEKPTIIVYRDIEYWPENKD